VNAAAPSGAPSAGWTELERRFLFVATAVALALRLLHWQSFAPYPWFDFLGLDAKYYDEWARRILESGLQGKDPYFMGPLYPHVLAAVYRVFGPSLDAMRAFQVVLSVATVPLVHLLGRAWGGSRLAMISSGLTALYGPLIYYSVSLLYPTITVFLAAFLLLALHRAASHRSFAWAAGAGLTLGVFALGRGNILLFAPAAFFWLVAAWGRPFAPVLRDPRPGLPAGLVLTAGTLLALLPATIHNLRTGDPTLLTTNAGLNLYIGNGPMARGGHETPVLIVERPDGTTETITADLQQDVECRTEAEAVTGHPMSYTEVSSFWFHRTMDQVRAHPGHALGLLVMKFVHFWSTYEIPQIEHFGYFRRFSLPLRGPVLSFGIVGPLALIGMILAWPDRRRWALPYLFVSLYCLAVVVFFVLARYRLPIVPGLFLFAALAMSRTWDAIRSGRRVPAGVVLGGAVVAGLMMRANVYGVDESKGIAQILYRHGIVADAEGRVEDAVGHYRDALALKPEYEKAHLNLGVDLARLGAPEEALAELEEAERLDPEYYRAPYNRGLVLEALGRGDEAEAAYRRSLELEPRYLIARVALAERAILHGDRAAAREQLEAVTTYDDRWMADSHAQAQGIAHRWVRLLDEADARAAAGDVDCLAASPAFRQAEVARLRQRGPEALERLKEYFVEGGDCAMAYRSLGDLLSAANQWPGAVDAYQRALGADADLTGAHLGLARAAAVRGDAETAIAELMAERAADPAEPYPLLELGLVHERILRDGVAAREWFDRYLEEGGSAELLKARRSGWNPGGGS
jgi:tetratricopeptide (TPR) repeat protein